MAYKGYAFRTTGATIALSRLEFSIALKAFMVAQGWVLHDTYNGVKATTTLTASGQPSDGQQMVLDTKTYTLKTNLTPAEGEIKIGGTAAITLDNIKAAINRDDPGNNDGVIYKVAAAHTTVEATTNTDTTQIFGWRVTGETGNACATTETLSNMSFTSALMTGGVNDIQVYKSNGESGNEPYGYEWIDNNATSGYINFKSYQFWDAGAHTGTRLAYIASAGWCQPSEFSINNDCLIAGDKNFIYLNVNATTTAAGSRAMVFGHIPRRCHSQITTTTDAIVAGGPVSIPVVDTTGFIAGQDVQIVGPEGCGRMTVNSIDATHIVVANLARNYAAGAYMGVPASVFGWYAISGALFQPCCYFNDAGLSVGASGYTLVPLFATPYAMTYDHKQLVTPILYYVNAIANIGITDDNAVYTVLTSSFDAALMNTDGSLPETSTVTSAGNTTLVDGTKSWTPDALIGKFVVLVGSTGIGQMRKITDNDGTTLTVSPAWYINPDGTTSYKICDKFYRAFSSQVYGAVGSLLVITDTSTPA